MSSLRVPGCPRVTSLLCSVTKVPTYQRSRRGNQATAHDGRSSSGWNLGWYHLPSWVHFTQAQIVFESPASLREVGESTYILPVATSPRQGIGGHQPLTAPVETPAREVQRSQSDRARNVKRTPGVTRGHQGSRSLSPPAVSCKPPLFDSAMMSRRPPIIQSVKKQHSV